MAVATPIPFVKARFFDRCGKPLAGGKVYTYEPHSTTPKATYTAPISGTPNTNPITLDAAGEADIYLAGRYRIIVQDSKGVVVNDNDDVGSWYSGDLDSQLESINQYLNNSGDVLIASQQARIDAMVNTGLVGAGSTDLLVALSSGRTQRDKNTEIISIKDYGAIGDGTYHPLSEKFTTLAAAQAKYPVATSLEQPIDDAAINQALADHRRVFAPAGDYVVWSIRIPTKTWLQTAGFATKITQHTSAAIDTAIIYMAGSNSKLLPAISTKGQIATHTGEWNHGVYVYAGASKFGAITGVEIGDVYAEDIRGDAVCIAQGSDANKVLLSDIKVGSIYGNNCYRQVLSVISGSNIRVDSVNGDKIGLYTVDIETNAGSGVMTDVKIGYVRGSKVGIIGTTAADYCDNIKFGVLDLDPAYMQPCSVPYPNQGSNQDDGLVLRNVYSAKVGTLKAKNHNRCSLFVVTNTGELGCKNLHIDRLEMTNSSLTDTTYNAFAAGANTTKLTVDHLILNSNGQTSKHGLLSFIAPVIKKAEVILGDNCAIVSNSPSASLSKVRKLDSTGTGIIVHNSASSIVDDATGTYQRVTSNADKCTISNSSVTASVFIADSANSNHTVINSTLNSEFTSIGTLKSGYTNAFRQGVSYFWIDVNGRMRIKSSAPTSDTDGVVVGSQGMSATIAYDPPSLAAGEVQSTTVTLTGAVMGDSVTCSFSLSLAGTQMWAEVTAANTVTVYHRNSTAAAVDLASGTLKVKII